MTNRTIEQGEQTRRRILDAAVELFGKFGYRGCTLSQIAEAAGVTRPNVIHHFGSKEELLAELLDDQFKITPGILEEIAEGQSTIADHFEHLAMHGLHSPEHVQFFSVFAGESLTDGHPAQEYFRHRYDLLRDRYVDAILKHATASGIEIDSEDVRQLVNVVVATLDGLQLQWLHNSSAVDLRRDMAMVTDLIRRRLNEISLKA